MKFRYLVMISLNLYIFVFGLLVIFSMIYSILGYDSDFYSKLYSLYYLQQQEIITVKYITIVQQLIRGKQFSYVLQNSYQQSTLYMLQSNLQYRQEFNSQGYQIKSMNTSHDTNYNYDFVNYLVHVNQKYSQINEVTILCDDSFGVSFQISSENWYEKLSSQCIENCSQITTDISDKLITMTIQDQVQRWTLREKNCLLQIVNIIDLPFIYRGLLKDNQLGFIIRNKVYSYQTSGLISQSNISNLFNTTSDTLDIENKIDALDIEHQMLLFNYQSVSSTRSSYIFALISYPFHQQFTKADQQNSQIVYSQNVPYSEIDILYIRVYLNYQYFLIQLIISSVVYSFIFVYNWRKSVQIASSIEIPIKQLIRLLRIGIVEHEDSDIPLEYYSSFYNCSEITVLFKTVIAQINSIKFINNTILCGVLDKVTDDKLFGNNKANDAKALLILSMSKQFYKINNFPTNVGICANNLARIHMRNHRYLEALNEQEESVLIAYQDLETYRNSKLPRKISTYRNTQYVRWIVKLWNFLKSLIESDTQVRPRSVSIQYYIGQNELFYQYKIIMRKYQLASILYNFSIYENHSYFLNESLNIFEEVLYEIGQISQTNYALQYMEINIISKQAYCYAKAGQIKRAKFQYSFANECFQRLKENYIHMKNIDPLIESSFVNIFHNIPMQILAEKLNGVSCIIDMLDGKFKSASKKLVTMIKAAGKCDPSQQKFAMRQLYHIFNHCKQDTKCLDDFNKSNLPKQTNIIYLIDYSKTMTSQQFTLAHSMCLNSLKLIDDNVNIAIYAFNEDLHEILSLQPKSQYSHVLENILKRLLIHPGGNALVIQALEKLIDQNCSDKKYQDTETFHRMSLNNDLIIDLTLEKSSHRYQQSSRPVLNEIEEVNYSQRSSLLSSQKVQQSFDSLDYINNEASSETNYICVFSQGVYDFTDDRLKQLQVTLKRFNIILLVFNIANQNMDMLYLRQLAQCNAHNQFFTNQKEINNYFNGLKIDNFTRRQYFEFF